MTANVVYTIKSPIVSADSSLPVLVRDPLLSGVANHGVRFIADTAFGFSYPAGAYSGRPAPGAPANGAVIGDISETANGSFAVAAGQTIGYAGGGFDFSSATAMGSALTIPASVAADLWTAYGGNAQQYLMSVYVKLPTLAQMSTASTQGSILTFAGSVGSYHPEIVDMLIIGGATPAMQFIRELTNSTIESNSLAINAADWGQLAQLSFWRNSAGRGWSLKTARARTTGAAVAGALNTNDFSAQPGLCGVKNGFWFPSADLTTNPVRNYRMYRVFVENLARSGRDPLTVLDGDWARVIARRDASAAANGGTSLIFA